MNSTLIREEIKKIKSNYVTSNGLPIRIFWTTLNKPTGNRLMPFRYSGMEFGIQEINSLEYKTLKKQKTTYNKQSAGNQLYFWHSMLGRLNNFISDALSEGIIKKDGMKKSAKGLIRVDKDGNGNYTYKDCCTPEEEAGGELKEVFRDGKLLIDQSLKEIRQRLGFIV